MSGLERMVSLLRSESGISRLGYLIVVGGTALLLGSGLAGRYATEMEEVRQSELKARAIAEARLEDKKSDEVAVTLSEMIKESLRLEESAPNSNISACSALAKVEEAKRYINLIKSIYGKEFFIKHADKLMIYSHQVRRYWYHMNNRWRYDEVVDRAWEIYALEIYGRGCK